MIYENVIRRLQVMYESLTREVKRDDSDTREVKCDVRGCHVGG